MVLESIQPSLGSVVHPNVRCLIGLYGAHKDDDGLDAAFSAVLDDPVGVCDDDDDTDLLQYALEVDDMDYIRFLIGSQSLKPDGNQVTLVTLQESDAAEPTRLTKQTFAHPDGEVIGLTALAAQPDWFVSVYSTYSADHPDHLRSGARVWRLPNTVVNTGSGCASPSGRQATRTGEERDDADLAHISQSNIALEYVTTLPLDRYTGVRKIASHPSSSCADLACIVSSPLSSATSTAAHLTSTTTYVTILQAPSQSGASGDYREAAHAQFSMPRASHIFTSYLKTNPSHVYKTLNTTTTTTTTTNRVAVTSAPQSLRWSPYQQAGHLAVAFASGVLGWDVRSMEPCYWLEAAHWPCVRDLDFNPHRPTILATGGEDGCLRLWDLRYLKSRPTSTHNTCEAKSTASAFGWPEDATEPLYSVQAHSHWIWCVRYHPTRDQLLLSAGSDCRVCLHNLASFSSDAEGQSDEEYNDLSDTTSLHSSRLNETRSARSGILDDGLIGRLEQHEESVYAADWSPVDPWYFASVSYDGNLLINQVPEAVKFRILLEANEE